MIRVQRYEKKQSRPQNVTKYLNLTLPPFGRGPPEASGTRGSQAGLRRDRCNTGPIRRTPREGALRMKCRPGTAVRRARGQSSRSTPFRWPDPPVGPPTRRWGRPVLLVAAAAARLIIIKLIVSYELFLIHLNRVSFKFIGR